jgi:N-methylhydantoinase A/oxoprolinase/acetone carboxylase beta subunit
VPELRKAPRRSRGFRLASAALPAERGLRLRRGAARVEYARFARAMLPAGITIEGPARIEDDGATIVVEPRGVARVDREGNVRLAARKP